MVMEMYFGLFVAALFVIGAAMGSFAACQVWRIRKNDKSHRSHCMSCDYELAWYDNVPILSWLFLRGRCRKCGGKIGWMEILTELILGLVFVVVGLNFDLTDAMSVVQLVLFLVLLTGLAILFIYDAKWGKLPSVVLTFSIICASIIAALNLGALFSVAGFSWGVIWNYLGALMVLPLLYFLMYRLSHEKWVGGGDWLLALALALVLGDFWLAFFCLFGANLLGSMIMLPVMKLKKKKTDMRIAFGPFLIAAFLLVFLLKDYLLDWLVI